MRVTPTPPQGQRLSGLLAGLLIAVLLGPLAGTAEAAPTPSGNPSIEVQNRTGNHAMGVTIALREGGGRPGSTTPSAAAVASVPGIDVSTYQGNVNW